MITNQSRRSDLLFCLLALATAVTLAWPVLEHFADGTPIRGQVVTWQWIAAFCAFVMAVSLAMLLRLPAVMRWLLFLAQVASVMAMAMFVNWAMMTAFLMIIAWQVGLVTSPRKAVLWTIAQTLAVVATLAQALDPDLCWVIGKAFALQLLLVFTAQALRREIAASAALARSNAELERAQSLLSASVRDNERLRISRELHDAWGHELTALGLQLEIASHSSDPAAVRAHVARAKDLSKSLLEKVRDVVATMRTTEFDRLESDLAQLARSVPHPSIHLALEPNLQLTPSQAHTLMRCAQEAVTNCIRHAEADNLWLDISSTCDGVRLRAVDDGRAAVVDGGVGAGLRGMRERIEGLGGRLVAGTRLNDPGYSIDAWLPMGGATAA